jgi:hypothetical protein
MLIDVKKEEHILDGLWLHGRGYVLSNEVFSKEIRNTTLVQTGLKLTEVADFWKPAKGSNPEYSWKELIELSLKILSSDLTKLICHTMYLEKDCLNKSFDILDLEPVELPTNIVEVAKCLNLTSTWVDFHNNKQSLLRKFKMYGEDTSLPVFGTWMHWISFATQILSNENTNRSCVSLYCKEVGFVCK